MTHGDAQPEWLFGYRPVFIFGPIRLNIAVSSIRGSQVSYAAVSPTFTTEPWSTLTGEGENISWKDYFLSQRPWKLQLSAAVRHFSSLHPSSLTFQLCLRVAAEQPAGSWSPGNSFIFHTWIKSRRHCISAVHSALRRRNVVFIRQDAVEISRQREIRRRLWG